VAINQVRDDDSVFENKKEQEKVSLVKDEHYVVERCYENSFSKLTHIIVKQVHRKARVGVRNLSQFVCHGKKDLREVLNYDKLIKVGSKKPQEKHVQIASSRRKRKRRVWVSKHKHFIGLKENSISKVFKTWIWHGPIKLKYATVTHTGNVPSNHPETIISSTVPLTMVNIALRGRQPVLRILCRLRFSTTGGGIKVGVTTKAFISFKDFSKRFIRISILSSREAAICWSSKELEGEEDERGAFVLTLESVTQLREYLTLDLLSIIAKHSRGILSKKLTHAAESKAS
nr:hypothetical protein [Tanacetum cinerariifolium]